MPTSPLEEERKWMSRASRASGELYLLVDEEQRAHIEGIEDDPVAMWVKLASIHVQKKPGARFNAYDDFFSLRNRPAESLTSLISRLDHSMRKIRQLRPKTFTLATLDDELTCMTMIRALPEEYSTFTSSLLLLGSVDKETLSDAFITEELNRSRRPKVPTSSSLDSALSSVQNDPVFGFCGTKGHLEQHCFTKQHASKTAKEQRKNMPPKRPQKALESSKPSPSNSAPSTAPAAPQNAAKASQDPPGAME